MCRLGGKGGMRGGQTLTHKAGRNRRGSNATGGGGAYTRKQLQRLGLLVVVGVPKALESTCTHVMR